MDNTDVLERMAQNNPFKSYQKTILGKLYIQYINPINQSQEGMILEGDPKKGDGIFHVWSQLEDLFFRRANRTLFEKGFLKEYTKPIIIEKSPNEKTDEEIEALFSERYLTFQNEVNRIDSEITLQRMIVIGESLGKDKYVSFVKQRLAEVQKQEFEVVEENAN